jgi:integrase
VGQLGVVTEKIKHLVRDFDRHGNERLYVRAPGRPKVRLRQPFGTVEFWTEYNAALAGAQSDNRSKSKRALPGSLRWLCERYIEGGNYKRLDKRTRYVRRLWIDRISEHNNDGAKPFRLMEPRHIRARRDEMVDKPAAANDYLKTLNGIFRFAIEAGHADRNPVKDVTYIRNGSTGYHTWTRQEVSQFEKRHPVASKARLALAILLYTGARRSDAVRFGEPMVQVEYEQRW